VYNAQKAREKSMKLGSKCLLKEWFWIKIFIKDEVKNHNLRTSYYFGESVTDEVKTEIKNRLEKLKYVVKFGTGTYDQRRIYIEW
jgi:hypothetical protein